MSQTLPDGAHALLVTKTGEVVLVAKGLQYTFDPRNAGKVAMFGGGIEVGESVEQALCRELREELELIVTKSALEPLGTYQKTEAEDAASCTVHVFIVRNVDPASLTLHEGDHEKTGTPRPTDHNKNIILDTPEALLARSDLTRITRLALESYALRLGDTP